MNIRKPKVKLNERGFTFVEVIAVTAIILILLGVSGVAVAQHRSRLQITELDNAAREIYMAAENRAVLLAASSRLAELVESPARQLELPGGVASGYYVAQSDAVLSELLPENSIEQNLRGGHFYIIYEIKSGCVSDVFFAWQPIETLVGGDFQSFYDTWRQAEQTDRMRANPMLGYFGGGLAQGENIGAISTATLLVQIENAERLTVQVSCQLPGSLTLSDVDLQVELVQDADFGQKTITLSGFEYNIRRTSNADGYTWVLDSLDGYRFMELSDDLKPGADFTVRARLTSPDGKFLPVSASDMSNSLFAYAADSNGGTARLQYLRHLQNLDVSFSHVSGKSQAVQIAEILDADNETYPNYAFLPIINDSLLAYTASDNNGGAYAIRGLTVLAESAGGRPGGLFARAKNCQFADLRLINAQVKAGNSSAGALLGEAENCQFDKCWVYWEPTQEADLRSLLGSDAEGSAYRYQIAGDNVGGLIGKISGSCQIENCLAATLAQGKTAAGGLIGLAAGNVDVKNSYADCYLSSANSVAGLIGRLEGAANSASLTDCYAAGFIDMTGVNQAAGLCNGSGQTNTQNVYSVVRYAKNQAGAKYFDLTENGRTPGNDLFNNSFYLGVGSRGMSYAAMTSPEFAGKLGAAFEWKGARQSYPYNLREHLQLVLYSFPGLAGLPHYGDWGAEFKEPSLVYYEQYSDGSYGFAGGNARYLIRELSDNKTVVADGYAVAFLANDLGTANSINLKYTWFAGEKSQTETVKRNKTDLLKTSGANDDGNVADYYLAPLPEHLVNSAQAEENFYCYLQFELEIGSDVTNVSSGEYFYNPHFAETIIPYVQTVEEPISWTAASAAAYAGELADNLAAISVRTPRHLYALSSFKNYYHNDKHRYIFRQNLALNYADYTGYNLFADKNEHGVFAQKPIGSYAQPFNAVYNGGCHSISGVVFAAPDSKPYYAGLFGYSDGVLRDIVYQLDAAKTITLTHGEAYANLYAGGLLGGNAGTVQNCAVAGLRLEGYAFGASIYAGGLVGQNNGIVRNCGAETACLLGDGSGFANVWLGGLVGDNTRTINNSYAVGRLDVTADGTSNALICGFAGYNSGNISDCYAAVDLRSSGQNAVTSGFCAQSGLSCCYFLNNGNFTYRGVSYTASYPSGQAQEIAYADLSEEAGLFSGMQLVIGDGYPYPRAVQKNGAPVHYGEWPARMELGEMGVYYWEKLALAGKESYYVSLLAVNPADKTIKRQSTLSEAYNDGGVVSDYGYGYYNKENIPLKLTAQDILYTTNGGKEQNFAIGMGRDEMIDQELANLMPGFEFHSWHSFSPDKDGKGSGVYPSAARNGVFSLQQGELTVKFLLNPHFAAALSAAKPAADWQLAEAVQAAPGSERNPYGVRSVAQLEFINWNSVKRNTRTVLEMDSNNKEFPYLSYPGHTDKYYWRQSHDLDGKEQEYTPIAEYYDTTYGNKGVIHGWFGGVYDGADYVIADMNIKGQVSSCAGLFGTVYNGTLKNIVLYSSDGNGKITAGGLVTTDGKPLRPDKSNLVNKSTWYAIGGLVGVVAASSDSAVQNCTVAGYTIEADIYTAYRVNTTDWGGSGIGGLAGFSNMELSGCTAETEIKVPATAQDNDNMRIGGLVGSCQQSISNCYAGGSISIDPKAELSRGKIYIGGIVGGSYMKPLQVGYDYNKLGVIGFYNDAPDYNPGLIDRINGIGMTNNAIYNCYSYVQLPSNDAHSSLAALYALGGTGDILTKAEDPKGNKLNHGACTIENSYYLDSVRPEVKNGQKTDVNGTAGVNKVSYRQLQGVENLSSGQNIYTLLKQFSRVTSSINDFSLLGKYSFPPSKRSELRGRDYPFPTILTRENGAYHVHYGAWPNFGIKREEGGAPIALDVFIKPDYTEKLALNGVSAGGAWAVRNDNEQIAAAEINGGVLSVQAKGVGTCKLTVVYTLNGEEYQLDITVNVTAELHLTPLTAEFEGQEPLILPLAVALEDFDKANFALTAVNTSSEYINVALAQPDENGLVQSIVLRRNEQELPEGVQSISELVNVSYTYTYNETTYSNSEVLTVFWQPEPEPDEGQENGRNKARRSIYAVGEDSVEI